jgi:hypothetical protein
MKTTHYITLCLSILLSVKSYAQIELFDAVTEPKSTILAPHRLISFKNGVLSEYRRDSATAPWQLEGRTTGVVDAYGNQTLLIVEEKDSTGTLQEEVNILRLLTYDGSNRISTFHTTIRLGGSSDRIVRVGSLTYKPNGQLFPVQGFDSVYTGTTGMGFPKVDSIVYDSSGKMIERIGYINLMGNQMMQDRKVFTYTGSNMTQLTVYEDDGGSWLENERITLTHDGSGNITRRLRESYDGSSSSWILDQLDSATYSGSNMTSSVRYQHNGTSWDFEEGYTYSYTGSNLTELIEKRWDGTAIVDDKKFNLYYTANKIDSALGFPSNGSGGWLADASNRIIFTPGPSVGLKPVVKNNFAVNVYPNPATSNVSFSTDMNGGVLSVYNITGQRVMAAVIENNTLNVSALNGGIYFITIEKEGKSYHSKLSVK